MCEKQIVGGREVGSSNVSVMATNVSPLADDLEVNRGDMEVQKPVVIDLYNSSMGGVDRADQLREYYSVGRSCYK